MLKCTAAEKQPALHARRSGRKPIEEEGIIGYIQILEAMFTGFHIIPDQVAVLAGNRLQFYIGAVIHTGTGDAEQEVLTVLPGIGEIVPDKPDLQFKERHIRIA